MRDAKAAYAACQDGAAAKVALRAAIKAAQADLKVAGLHNADNPLWFRRAPPSPRCPPPPPFRFARRAVTATPLAGSSRPRARSSPTPYLPYGFARLHNCFQNAGKQLLELPLRKVQAGIEAGNIAVWATWDDAARHFDRWVVQWAGSHPVRRRAFATHPCLTPLHPCPPPQAVHGKCATSGLSFPLQGRADGDARARHEGAAAGVAHGGERPPPRARSPGAPPPCRSTRS